MSDKSEKVTDGYYFVAGCMDNNLYLFNRTNSEPMWTYNAGNSVTKVDISADGFYIVGSSNDWVLHLLNRTTNAPMWTSSELNGEGRYVSISHDGYYIVSHHYDTSLLKHNRTSPDSFGELPGYEDNIVFSPDSYHYVASSQNDMNSSCLFHISNDTPIINFTSSWRHSCLSVSSGGTYMAVVQQAGMCYVLKNTSSVPIGSFQMEGYAHYVSMSNNGKYIVAGTLNNKTYLFDNTDVQIEGNGGGNGDDDDEIKKGLFDWFMELMEEDYFWPALGVTSGIVIGLIGLVFRIKTYKATKSALESKKT